MFLTHNLWTKPILWWSLIFNSWDFCFNYVHSLICFDSCVLGVFVGPPWRAAGSKCADCALLSGAHRCSLWHQRGQTVRAPVRCQGQAGRGSESPPTSSPGHQNASFLERYVSCILIGRIYKCHPLMYCWKSQCNERMRHKENLQCLHPLKLYVPPSYPSDSIDLTLQTRSSVQQAP